MFTMYGLYEQPGWAIAGLLLISVWVLIWKGMALWFSAKNKQKGWFIALLILNTLGLLSIVYLIWFRPKKAKVVRESKVEEFIVEEVKKKPAMKKKKVQKETEKKEA